MSKRPVWVDGKRYESMADAAAAIGSRPHERLQGREVRLPAQRAAHPLRAGGRREAVRLPARVPLPRLRGVRARERPDRQAHGVLLAAVLAALLAAPGTIRTGIEGRGMRGR